jgi:hypothetical protein
VYEIHRQHIFYLLLQDQGTSAALVSSKNLH